MKVKPTLILTFTWACMNTHTEAIHERFSCWRPFLDQFLWRKQACCNACCNALPIAAMPTSKGHGLQSGRNAQMIQAAEWPHLLEEANHQFQRTLNQALCTSCFFDLIKCNFFTLWNHVKCFSLRLSKNFAFILLIQAAERHQYSVVWLQYAKTENLHHNLTY